MARILALVLATAVLAAASAHKSSLELPARRWDALATVPGQWQSVFVTGKSGSFQAEVKPSQAGVAANPTTFKWETNEVARAQFNDTLMEVGWTFLYVVTNENAPNSHQAYGAGYLEGKITASRIYQYGMNTGTNASIPEPITDFIAESNSWLQSQVKANPTDDYWVQVGLWAEQVGGITDGFYAGCSGEECYVIDSFVVNINIGATIGTVAGKFDLLADDPDNNPTLLRTENGHCTGFVKVLPDNADLYIGHDTWTAFNTMTRVYKTYDTPFKLQDGSIIPGRRQAFSSYPASVYSGDDYYTLSSGLVVAETTIGTYNTTALDQILPTQLYECARNTVANRLATSGETWSVLFGTNNNGCYNNQFYIVDYNLFTPGQPLQPNTLWVFEQLPGYYQASDLTELLIEQNYYGSYNLPIYKETIALSNITAVVKEYGDWFTYRGTARAKIMARDHDKVSNVDAMKAFMRYNNFKHDPLARCPCSPPYTGENGIACRSDLNPADGKFNIPAFRQRNHAATDSKFTTSAMMKNGLQSWAISSPTYDQQPVFQWSTSPYAHVPHVGQPDVWQFPWVVVGFAANE